MVEDDYFKLFFSPQEPVVSSTKLSDFFEPYLLDDNGINSFYCGGYKLFPCAESVWLYCCNFVTLAEMRVNLTQKLLENHMNRCKISQRREERKEKAG